MRNLQKILALVLALIMSFSLVATAGAFSDDGDISDAYKDAVTVLNGLEVFKGYDNGATFQPKGNITRAEVAAIIYRIATGDVKDTQASIYSTYGQFTDVLDGSWYAGYVNYCANAGYIKGRGNKIFDPQATVTGYEALAMILRAVGYDKNGEFTGSNWQIRTASIANERGISKNVTSAMLGQAATREVVAELLFRSIIIPKVNFNANTLSYTEKPLNADGKKDTLGYESLKLEEIEGVVTANEYADLEGTSTLSAGRTRMHVDGADARDYNLDIASTLDDIGESRVAYIQNGNLSKVFVLSSTGDNVIYDDGKDIDVDDARKEAKKEGSDTTTTLKLDDSTQYFRNYDPIEEQEAKWRIEYVYKMSNTALAAAKSLANSDSSRTVLVNGRDAGILYEVNADGSRGNQVAPLAIADADRTTLGTYEYVKVIPANNRLSETDKKCIREIFRVADYQNGSYIDGEVYVGTTSQAKLDDISDDISYNEFVSTYINTIKNDDITSSDLGYRLKLIDNNDDTIVDYVLQTVYTVTKIASVSSDNKYTLMTKNISLTGIDEVNNVDNDIDVVKFNADDELKAEDVVLYAVIDGKAQTWLAESTSTKVDKIDRGNKKVTTTDGTEYADSDVNVRPKNADEARSIGLGDDVVDMTGNNTYSLYFDLYGNLAAFNEADEAFVLVVDGWYNSTKGGAEYAVKVWEDGSIQTKDVTSSGELFIEQNTNNDWGQIRDLGAVNANGGKALNADRTLADGTLDPKEDNIRTTVALLNSDGVMTPVDMAYHTIKTNAMIAMDNDQLPDRVGKAGRIYNTRTNINEREAYNADGGAASVQALSTTKYYFVYNAYSDWTGRTISKVVREYTGYQNLPKDINGDPNYLDHVEDVYAVGTRASSATNSVYYTADIVVVELDNTYYKTLGGEQVFIPYFPVVGTGVTREEVELIRQSGVKETVTLDLTRSDIRYYDDAQGIRAGGLYYMWQSDVDSNIYYVRSMSAADIAASQRYYVGMVNYSTGGNGIGTLPSNYVDVDIYGRDVNGVCSPLGQTQRANDVPSSSKYYTLKYNGSNVATLAEVSREAALTQRPEADRSRADYCPSGVNEFTASGGYQLNEVLVAYNVVNGYEEIAYVVSFNEYQSYDGPNTREHTHDRAQTVWGDCLTVVGGVAPDPEAAYKAAKDAYDTAKAANDNLVNADLDVLNNILAKINTAETNEHYAGLTQAQKDNLAAWKAEVNQAIADKNLSTTEWKVEANLTNLTADPAFPAVLAENGSFTTTLTADDGYTLPADVTVVNATKAYDAATGVLTISNPTGDVSVTAAGVSAEGEYDVTVSIAATLGFDEYTGSITKKTANGKVLTLAAAEILNAIPEIKALGETIVNQCKVVIDGEVKDSWTFTDPGAAMNLSIDIQIQINPDDDPFVPDTTRAARPAARAGSDVTEQTGTFYFTVNEDEEIDWEKSVTMGVRCEKNNDPSNVNRIPAGDGKVTLMFRATVAVRNGNISYIFNMATKKIATGEDAAVTVRVSDDAPSGVQVKSASGWASSYVDKTAKVNGTITVTVQTIDTTARAPFVVGDSSVKFTAANAAKTEWTATVPVTAAVQVVEVSAGTYATVSMTAQNNVTITGAVAGEATGIAIKGKNTDNEDTFGPVSFTVSVPAGKIPKVGGTLTNWEVSYNRIAGSETQWIVTLLGNSSATNITDGTISFQNVPVVTMSTSEREKVKFENNDPAPTYEVSSGSISIKFYADAKQNPELEIKENVYTDKELTLDSADKSHTGMNAWVLTLNNVTGNMTVDVRLADYPMIEVDDNTASTPFTTPATDPDGMQMELVAAEDGVGKEGVKAPGGVAEIYVWVHPDFVIDTTSAATIGSVTDKDATSATGVTISAVKAAHEPRYDGYIMWKISVGELDVTKSPYTFAAEDLIEVHTVYLQATSGIIMNPTHKTVVDGKNVEFLVNVPDTGYRPYIDATDLVNVGVGSSVEIVREDNTSNWKITIKTVTESDNDTTEIIPVTVMKLPTIAVQYDLGVIPGTYASSEVVQRNAAGDYTKTVSFKLEDGYSLSDTPISYQVNGETPGAQATKQINRNEIWQRGDEYVVKVTLLHDDDTTAGNGEFDFDQTTVTVVVNATKGHTVTLDLPKDENGIEVVQPDKWEKRSKTVKDGETVTFDLIATGDWEIVSTDEYTAERQTMTDPNASTIPYKVTVKNPVRSSFTLKIEAREELGLNYTAKTGGTVTATELVLVGGGTGDKAQKIRDHRIDFEFTVEKGYIPDIKLSDTEGGKVTATTKLACVDYAVSGNTGTSKWTLALTDITKDIIVIFDVKSAVSVVDLGDGVDTTGIGSLTNKFAETLTDTASKWKLIDSDDYRPVDAMGRYQFVATNALHQDLKPDNSGKEISFIVFVAEGCEIVYDAGEVVTSDERYYWTAVACDKNDVGTRRMEGYYPVNIVLTINENWVGQDNIDNGKWNSVMGIPFYVVNTDVSALVS